jgi:signal transduction histidine kinase/DNA-binding response OmpR family regulator
MNGDCLIIFASVHLKLVRLLFLLLSFLVSNFPAVCSVGFGKHAELDASRIVHTAYQSDDSSKVDALIKLFTKTFGSDVDQAEMYAREALTLSNHLNYVKGMIDSHRSLGEVYRIKGNFELAEEFLGRAVSLCREKTDDIALAKNYLALNRLSFVRGDYVKAGEYNKKAFEIGEELADGEVLADAYGNEGILHGIRGQYPVAIEHFLKSLDMYKSLKDELRAAVTLMRIGHTFELAGSYEKAMDYFLQSLEVNQRLNHFGNMGWCYLNMGVTYGRMNKDNDAPKLDYFEQALVMSEKASDFRLQLACLDNIGGLYSTRRDFENANTFLMKAYRLSQEAGHNSRTVYITGNLAENFLYTGQFDSALIFGRENLRIALEERNTFEKRQAYSVLSQIHAARNENKQAYDMLLRHVSLSDSIFNVQKSQQIEDLREKYETEKKEQAILLLTKEKAAAEFRRNTFALLSGLLLMVGFLVFVILRLRVKKNRLMLEKEIELDRMKSRFFANISHEFRTPLTLILGPIDELLTREENNEIHKYLKPMRRNAGRLLELVNQLLELSRIESGRLRPNLTRNNVVAIVKGVAMSFDSLAEMNGIRLEVTTEGEPIEMYFDRDKFEKILTNLLSNAFKFTPDNGSISVHAQCTGDCRLAGVSECLQVMVKDSGRGISEVEIGHIFDRFYQADNNQLHQQDGSGIGLALTKELVELHRGIIWARSVSEQGTEIGVQLPLNLEEILKDCVAETVPADKPLSVRYIEEGGVDFVENADAEIDSQKPIVLLIEDHVDVRNYIRDSLEKAFRVIEASDGEEGIAMAIDKIPDLVLCDVMMPNMNGNQVCVYLKDEEKTSHIPIILLTAKADMESRIEGLKTRADDYLTKPFVPKELLMRIHNLIESRKMLREKFMQSIMLKPKGVPVDSVDEKFLRRMIDLMEIHIGDEKFGVEMLGVEIGMSRSQLHRKLKALIGQGPNQFIRSFRLNRAHDLLKVNAATAAEIAYSVGFSSPSYFTKCFHEQFGYTPTEIPA